MSEIPSDPSTIFRELFSARYGTDPANLFLNAPPLNDILKTVLSHRSVRAYRPDPLPLGTLELLLAAAQSAPTSSNLQAWSLLGVV